MAKRTQTKTLNPEQILIAEFHYAEQSAFQANQDRIALYNYFLSTGGALIAALFVGNLEKSLDRGIFISVFLGLAVWGLISYLKLLKIRLAWNSSILAMNQIKEFFITNSAKLDLTPAFRWKNSSKPDTGKIWSITFLMGLMFAFVDSFTLGIALYILTNVMITAILIAAGFFILHFVIWKLILKD